MKLEHEGYVMEIAEDGKDGLTRAVKGNWDLILLDIMLPSLNGIEVLRHYRRHNPPTPVLFLTARESLPDKVAGLDQGIRSGRKIDLTPREFDLLSVLMKQAGQVLEREQIIREVWGFDFVGDTNVVDVYTRYLRKKIDNLL